MQLVCCVGLGKFFEEEISKFSKGLVALGFGFPFMDSRVKGAHVFYGSFDEGMVSLGV